MPGAVRASDRPCPRSCGAHLPQRASFPTWHKSGTFLATFFVDQVTIVCSFGLSVGRPYRMLPQRRCSWMVVRSGLNGNTRIGAKSENDTAIVHVIRNPFDVVASSYQFHARGEECDKGPFRQVCVEMANESLPAGVGPS